MSTRAALLLVLAVLSTSTGAQAPLETTTAPSILVTGQRPGPALWRVSKDDHVLWIFGSYAPLPRQIDWRSQQLETVLADSQELLDTPGTRSCKRRPSTFFFTPARNGKAVMIFSELPQPTEITVPGVSRSSCESARTVSSCCERQSICRGRGA